MIDRAHLCTELTATWHRDIPLAAATQIGIESYDGHTLAVRAPLAPNRNLHGTAFAGSLFSVCVLTGWGTVWLALRERGLAGAIVVADSSSLYRTAVTSDLLCRCTPDAAALAAGVEQLAAKGRATFDVACAIESDGKRAVSFTAAYVVHA